MGQNTGSWVKYCGFARFVKRNSESEEDKSSLQMLNVSFLDCVWTHDAHTASAITKVFFV